jgi:hypothetical protein
MSGLFLPACFHAALWDFRGRLVWSEGSSAETAKPGDQTFWAYFNQKKPDLAIMTLRRGRRVWVGEA